MAKRKLPNMGIRRQRGTYNPNTGIWTNGTLNTGTTLTPTHNSQNHSNNRGPPLQQLSKSTTPGSTH